MDINIVASSYELRTIGRMIYMCYESGQRYLRDNVTQWLRNEGTP